MLRNNFFVRQIARLQRWMDSVPGQTFLNYAYSWGAAIVILGALFKLTHIAGANIMLFIGMGTEVFVFFISGFDRPFDKTEQTVITEEFVDDDEYYDDDEEIGDDDSADDDDATEDQPVTPIRRRSGGGVVAGGVIVVGGGGSTETPAPTAEKPVTTKGDVVDEVTRKAIDTALPEGGDEGDRLAKIIRMANDELLRRAQAVLSPEMEQASQDYIAKLKSLTETLTKMDEQSSRLTQDSQEMENLNRTLVGINKIYDLHFASISKQVTTIEQINVQTNELAAKIEEVNQIYARMMQQLNVMANPGLNPTNNA